MARALHRGDVDGAMLNAADRALVAYAEKLTRTPDSIDDADTDGLRRHGFDDTAIWHATFTAAQFNCYARMADSFGITPPPTMLDALDRD